MQTLDTLDSVCDIADNNAVPIYIYTIDMYMAYMYTHTYTILFVMYCMLSYVTGGVCELIVRNLGTQLQVWFSPF